MVQKIPGIILLAGFIVGVALGILFMSDTQSRTSIEYLQDAIDSSLQGYTKLTVAVQGTTVFLSSQCQRLSFDVTNDQAYSILQALQNKTSVRPLTHDFAADILENFDIRVTQIKIDRYEDQIYKAHMILERNDTLVEFDVRPSDAIALALRTGNSLYIKQDILQSYGNNTC